MIWPEGWEGEECNFTDHCSCPMVISTAQDLKNQAIFTECLYMSRVWCHSNHKLRMKLLKHRDLI